MTKSIPLAAVLALCALATGGAPPIGTTALASGARGTVQVTREVKHDTSPPLTVMAAPISTSATFPAQFAGIPAAGRPINSPDTSGRPLHSRDIPATNVSWDGVGANGFAPPDNEVVAGATEVMEQVNVEFAVYTKSGTTLRAPVPINTIFAGFGGGCQANNNGDGNVLYDNIAQRWVVSQFSVGTTPYLECVAVSATNDALGTWNRYAFAYANFPDYPKMGVWADGYYTTFNLFGGGGYIGPEVCAYDRTSMIFGLAATQQCFTPSGYSLLPASIDGYGLPAAGAPAWIVSLGSSGSGSTLSYWQFHVDWATPANSTLTGPTSLGVTAYTGLCTSFSRTQCVPQPATAQTLESLGDRLMFRLAYRNRAGVESLVATHSVVSGSSGGLRWYELTPSGASLSVAQSGTYAPDSDYRFLGSIAMDKFGDMALGYTRSSGATRPGVYYTGRLLGDPAGTMPQGEGVIQAGIGSQNGGLARWGDYSEMSVDPVDDCTFWYSNEYQPADGSFNWSTRIGAFRFPSCAVAADNDAPVYCDYTHVSGVASYSPALVTTKSLGTETRTVAANCTNGTGDDVGNYSFSMSGIHYEACANNWDAGGDAVGSVTVSGPEVSGAPGWFSYYRLGIHLFFSGAFVSTSPHETHNYLLWLDETTQCPVVSNTTFIGHGVVPSSEVGPAF